MLDVHVAPNGDQWGCEVNGNIRSTQATQDEAIKQGRFLAEDQNSELVIHGKDASSSASWNSQRCSALVGL
jgi:Uncharacterized protein conserved in bacteria (DUF2188)